eukprot:CAMPEP_0113714142 /NCGR_PEP_ID=MMETSP0038_2-20120614/32429_1 /TAXON_ID=2898 /ORGANISM="Cryptomonas paramecium" /LENGTH=153 /DNA_ID=CAMNT_0000641039 /DNA_START=15 /DNA_END=472 /DNA_ORIENTATION=- /assembly_acc=CAM_ASM_000170
MNLIRDCEVEYPREEDFEDFERYMVKISKRHEKDGLVKIVPPKSWVPRASYEGIDSGGIDFPIKTPIEQNWVGQRGVYRLVNVMKGETTLQKFRALALSGHIKEHGDRARRPADQRFWASMGNQAMRGPLYGSDVAGFSLFEDSAGAWDMRRL